MLIATSYSHTTFIALFPLLVVCSPVRHNDEFEAAEHQEFGQEAGADSLGDFLETPESVSDFHLAADTADSDKEPPKWVSGARLSASNVGPNQVQLLWEGASYEGPGPAVDNVGIAAFAVYRDGQAIATVGAELHSYINTGLQPDTNYLFQIQAGDKAGNWSTDGPSLAVNTECST